MAEYAWVAGGTMATLLIAAALVYWSVQEWRQGGGEPADTANEVSRPKPSEARPPESGVREAPGRDPE